MQTKLLQLLLLLAIVFNIAHASIIAAEDHCIHESVGEYIAEQDHDTKCGDLCDFHHLFHFTAIITSPVELLDTPLYSEQPDTKELTWHPPFLEIANKPPIA